MIRIVDMHMHLGFSDNPGELASNLRSCGIAAFSNSVTPDEFVRLQSDSCDYSLLRQGLGIHPWWIGSESDSGEMEVFFDSLFSDTLYIGEVGLDFYGTHVETRDMQLALFKHVASSCAQRGGCLISLHSVRAERELIDILEVTGCIENCTCILHSYSGPSDQLKRAVEDGCMFSIGPRMLSTKKGREYARVLPQDALLLETDLPKDLHERCDAKQIIASLQETLRTLSSLRSCETDALSESILRRSMYLLDL